MPAILRSMAHQLVRPSLAAGGVCCGLFYGWLFIVWTWVVPGSLMQQVTFVMAILLVWISLRVLLTVKSAPETVLGGIVFGLLLLNIALGIGGVAMLIFGSISPK
jgi:hypothetical protein